MLLVKWRNVSSLLKYFPKYPDVFICDMGFLKIICSHLSPRQEYIRQTATKAFHRHQVTFHLMKVKTLTDCRYLMVLSDQATAHLFVPRGCGRDFSRLFPPDLKQIHWGAGTWPLRIVWSFLASLFSWNQFSTYFPFVPTLRFLEGLLSISCFLTL